MEERKNTGTAEFRVLKGGPLQVSGGFVLKSPEGKILKSGDVIFLCRCGASANKPFCDGSHRRVGLND